MDIIERFRADVIGGKRGRIAEIAAATGIPVKTLRRLQYGETTDPKFSTVEPLRQFYEQKKPR